MRRLQFYMYFAIMFALHGRSFAQETPRYSPQRPTISPYLNLLRDDTGPLPNYYSLVRPQLNQQSFDNRVLATTRTQADAVQKLTEITDAAAAGPTGSGSSFRDMSHFYNRSHFYPERKTSPQRQASSRGRR